ncbi:MAG: NADH dehydrogenase (quinone), partial [Alphaproteobacteria bacterium]
MGLSSALLVGFFHERRAPVENALRVFAVYRVSDAAMLSAAVLLHHWAGSGSLSSLFLDDASVSSGLSTGETTVIALLLIAAVAGKSALLPFSGWLPRAMEGPTPSSAVYYGALSIHAGCFLLMRAYPLLAQSPLAVWCTALVGGVTAVYATLTARVQSDVKSALAYAALTQVGIIVVEIACGLLALAFVHMLAHACFRLLQFMRAPNAIHELHDLVRASAASTEATHSMPPHTY